MQNMNYVVEEMLLVYLALGPAPLTALNGTLVQSRQEGIE